MEMKSSSTDSAKPTDSAALDWAIAGERSCLPSRPDESAHTRLRVLGRISRDRNYQLCGFSVWLSARTFASAAHSIAYGGCVDRAIEELIEQLQQFLLSEDFYWAVRIRLIKDELPEIVFRQNDRPDHLAQRNTLRGAARANLRVALLDVGFALLQ